MLFAHADNVIRLLHDVKKAYRIGYDDGYRGRRRGGGEHRGQPDQNGPTYLVIASYEELRDELTVIAGIIKAMGSQLTEPRNELERMVGLRKKGVIGGLKEESVRGDLTKAPNRA